MNFELTLLIRRPLYDLKSNKPHSIIWNFRNQDRYFHTNIISRVTHLLSNMILHLKIFEIFLLCPYSVGSWNVLSSVMMIVPWNFRTFTTISHGGKLNFAKNMKNWKCSTKIRVRCGWKFRLKSSASWRDESDFTLRRRVWVVVKQWNIRNFYSKRNKT